MGNHSSTNPQANFKPAAPVQQQKPALAPLTVPEGVRISEDLAGRVKLSPSGKRNASGESEAFKDSNSASSSQVNTPTSQVQISPKVNIAAELLPRVKTANTPTSASSPIDTGYSRQHFQDAAAIPSLNTSEHTRRIIGTSPLSPRISIQSEPPVISKPVDPAYVNSLNLPSELRSRIESYPC